jgi:hypothetical protein
MSDDHTRTVRIKRPSRVAQNDREACSEIRKLARSHKDGVLARDTATGHYQSVSESELKALATADELSLVSTQILRKVIQAAGKKDPAGGFDPYDNN